MKRKLSKDEMNNLKEKIKNRLNEGNSYKSIPFEDDEFQFNNDVNYDELTNEIINVNTEEEASEIIDDYHIVDIVDGIDDVEDDQDLMRFFRLLNVENQALVLEESDEELQLRIIELLDYDEIIDIFEYMSPDDIADILGELDFSTSKAILDRMKRSEANKLRELLGYAEDTAGGIMTTRFIAFKKNLNVKEVLEKIKIIAPKLEYIDTIFVLNDKRELIGEVELRDIIISNDTVKLEDLMDENIIYVNATDDQEKVAQLASRYSLKVIPVVNNKKNLLGIITIDDIIDVIQEENTEDIFKMSGITEEEAVDSPFKEIIQNRLPWLLINLITAFLASFTVGLFSQTIDKVVALAVVMPIVSGMGGNAGTQALTVTIRGIALDNLNDEKLKTILKYTFIGIFNGTVLGIICGGIIYVMYHNIYLSFIIFLAMIGNFIIACVVGYLIPILLKAMKIDPAMASAVILTTLTDVFGFLQFLGLATIFINKLV